MDVLDIFHEIALIRKLYEFSNVTRIDMCMSQLGITISSSYHPMNLDMKPNIASSLHLDPLIHHVTP